MVFCRGDIFPVVNLGGRLELVPFFLQMFRSGRFQTTMNGRRIYEMEDKNISCVSQWACRCGPIWELRPRPRPRPPSRTDSIPVKLLQKYTLTFALHLQIFILWWIANWIDYHLYILKWPLLFYTLHHRTNTIHHRNKPILFHRSTRRQLLHP